MYLSIVLLAPWRLWKSDVGIHFLDPEGLGVLRPLGELIKHAYHFMVAGLIAEALTIYEPVLSGPTFEVTAATNLSFTLVWVGTIATVAFGVFILHRFMHQEKRRELRRLEGLIRTVVTMFGSAIGYYRFASRNTWSAPSWR